MACELLLFGVGMKQYLIGLLVLCGFVAKAATYTLDWSPSSTPGVHYRVYSSTNGVDWKFERAVTNSLVVTMSGVAQNVTAFGVSAANNYGSESVKLTGSVLLPPGNLRIVPE